MFSTPSDTFCNSFFATNSVFNSKYICVSHDWNGWSFEKALKFWWLKRVLSYLARSFSDTSSTDDFFLSFWFVNSFEMLSLLNFFPIVCWSTHYCVSFDFFCFEIDKLARTDFLMKFFCFVCLCINKSSSDGVNFLHDLIMSVNCCFR